MHTGDLTQYLSICYNNVAIHHEKKTTDLFQNRNHLHFSRQTLLHEDSRDYARDIKPLTELHKHISSRLKYMVGMLQSPSTTSQYTHTVHAILKWKSLSHLTANK